MACPSQDGSRKDAIAPPHRPLRRRCKRGCRNSDAGNEPGVWKACFRDPLAPEPWPGGREADPQFGMAIFGFGGKKALFCVPRRRASAALSCVSSFSSAGT